MNSPAFLATPYCGSAPARGEILASWNADPLLVILLAGAIAAGAARFRSDPGRRLAWLSGCAVLVVAFISPVCALSSGLFAARSLHHLLVVALAAPLLGHALAARAGKLPLGLLAGIHFPIFWLWHVPALYAAALSDDGIYWIMQASLLGSGILFWAALYGARHAAAQLGALLAAVIQMGLLGAIVTFAPQPLYWPHFATTALYGLTPLQDQQLAGLIMWVASLPLVLAAGAPLLRRYVAEAKALA